MNPIHQIAKCNIPTNSRIAAVKYLISREDWSQEHYEGMIKTISGIEWKFADRREARYSLMYLVQETLRASENTDVFDMPKILESVVIQAQTYIKEHPWHFAQPDEVQKVDSNGNPKRKKGAKQEEAARIYQENKEDGKKAVIELFMADLDMSKAGATTYFYNMKKKFGA